MCIKTEQRYSHPSCIRKLLCKFVIITLKDQIIALSFFNNQKTDMRSLKAV